MKNIKPAICLLALMVFGCASLRLSKQMERFDMMSRSYADAIEWSDFEAARFFIKDAQPENPPLDFRKLQLVKVTSYEVRQLVISEDKSQVRQIVEVKYYKLNDNVVKTIIDNQLWEYDPAGESWYLQSGLPDFQ